MSLMERISHTKTSQEQEFDNAVLVHDILRQKLLGFITESASDRPGAISEQWHLDMTKGFSSPLIDIADNYKTNLRKIFSNGLGLEERRETPAKDEDLIRIGNTVAEEIAKMNQVCSEKTGLTLADATRSGDMITSKLRHAMPNGQSISDASRIAMGWYINPALSEFVSKIDHTEIALVRFDSVRESETAEQIGVLHVSEHQVCMNLPDTQLP